MAFAKLKQLMIFRAIGMFFSALYHLCSMVDRGAKAGDIMASNLEASATNYTEVSAIERETTYMEAKAESQAKQLKAKAKLAAKAKQIEQLES